MNLMFPLPRYCQVELKSWTVFDLCEWLTGNNLDIYQETFRTNNINGITFENFTIDDLNKLGLTDELHITKILTAREPHYNKRHRLTGWLSELKLFPEVIVIVVDYWIESKYELDMTKLQPLPENITEENTLGQGGAGVVYRGKLMQDDKKLPGVDVAVKKFFNGILPAKSVLMKECQLMMPLYHPNIGHVYGMNLKTDCLVMELAELGSLHNIIHQPRKFPLLKWKIRLQIAKDIANGLVYLHNDQKMIHRDLKCANILIRKDWSAMIADFGIARSALNNSGPMTSGVGTWAWMAPEMYDSKGTRTFAIDIYSFGMILYELLTRKLPFMREGDYPLPELARDVLAGIRPTLSSTDEQNAPVGYIKLMKQCWGKDPTKRPDALEVVKRIETFLEVPFPQLPRLRVIELNKTNPELQVALLGRTILASQFQIDQIPEYSQQAVAGDALSQARLGYCYERGIGGIKRDYSMAYHWYQKSSAQGHGEGQAGLAKLYLKGVAIEQVAKPNDEEKYPIPRSSSSTPSPSSRGSFLRTFSPSRLSRSLLNFLPSPVSRSYSSPVSILPPESSASNSSSSLALTSDSIAPQTTIEPIPSTVDDSQVSLPEVKEHDSRVPLPEVKEHNTKNDRDVEGLLYLRMSVEQNNARGRGLLGYCYLVGLGIKRDEGEAVRWLELAAEQGDVDACFHLGHCYEKGLVGKGTDAFQAFYWYELAAKQGHPIALFRLGLCYFYGQGVLKDYKQAVSKWEIVAKRGLADAQYNLGSCYKNGIYVIQNFKSAIQWYQRAANQEHAAAEYALGLLYMDGKGVPSDLSRAVEYWKQSAKRNFAPAQYQLGLCYKNGHGIQQDYTEAFTWFQLAANQQHLEAQFHLALCYRSGHGIEQNYEEALRLFKLTAERKFQEAQYMLGVIYQRGFLGQDVNTKEALKWYKAATDRHHPKRHTDAERQKDKLRRETSDDPFNQRSQSVIVNSIGMRSQGRSVSEFPSAGPGNLPVSRLRRNSAPLFVLP